MKLSAKGMARPFSIYEVEGILHYCVANMPGAVPLSSTLALNHVTLPYALRLAENGWQACIQQDLGFREGLNVCHGKITNKDVALSLKMDYIQNPSQLAT